MEHVPVEVVTLIFGYLSLQSLGRVALVCRAWNDIVTQHDTFLWRPICKSRTPQIGYLWRELAEEVVFACASPPTANLMFIQGTKD